MLHVVIKTKLPFQRAHNSLWIHACLKIKGEGERDNRSRRLKKNTEDYNFD